MVAAAGASIERARPFIDHFSTISTIASAVPTSGPAAGDVNPYGAAVVPDSTGNLVGGDVLVSNFNNAANQQGTGSSIVQISPSGQQSVFAVVPPPTSTSATGLTMGASRPGRPRRPRCLLPPMTSRARVGLWFYGSNERSDDEPA